VCIGVVGFLAMSIFEEDTRRIWWVDEFEETCNARMWGFGGVPSRIDKLVCIEVGEFVPI
jgi:hypothetical protein